MTARGRAIGQGAEPAPSAGGEVEPRPTFVQMYETHFPFVWRTVRRLGMPVANLDDIVQEIFIVAHRRLAEFEGRSSVKTWLFGIVANVVRNQRRALQARYADAPKAKSDADPDALADPREGPHEHAAKAEAARVVDRLLGTLDDDKREVFVLAELEQASAPEIAIALGIPLNTVYSRLRLARQAFAEAAARHRARDKWRAL